MGSETSKTINFQIDGMDCAHCVKTIEKAVGGLAGVEHVEVSLQTNSAVVRLNPEQITDEAVFETVEDAGFDVPR